MLIATQNNAIRTNHIKERMDRTQQNSRCGLCGERDETINYISECSKLAQKKYKTFPDWVGKVILFELYRKLKFDHTNKLYMRWYRHQRIGTRTRGLGNNGTFGNCSNYSIVEIGNNTETSPWDLRWLAVTQTLVRNPQLWMV